MRCSVRSHLKSQRPTAGRRKSGVVVKLIRKCGCLCRNGGAALRWSPTGAPTLIPGRRRREKTQREGTGVASPERRAEGSAPSAPQPPMRGFAERTEGNGSFRHFGEHGAEFVPWDSRRGRRGVGCQKKAPWGEGEWGERANEKRRARRGYGSVRCCLAVRLCAALLGRNSSRRTHILAPGQVVAQQ